MYNKKRSFTMCLIMSLFTSMLLIGCGPSIQTGVTCTFNSDPPFAKLYSLDGSKYYGESPHDLYWKVNAADREKGYINGSGVKARWISGAEKRINSIRLKINGTKRSYTFFRPNTDNAYIDANYAASKQNEALYKKQTNIQSQANSWNNYWNTMNAINMTGNLLTN